MRIKAITKLFQQICFDSFKASIHFFACKLGFLLQCQCLAQVLSPSDELACLHCTVQILTNYFTGIRVNYRQLFELARNHHLLPSIEWGKFHGTPKKFTLLFIFRLMLIWQAKQRFALSSFDVAFISPQEIKCSGFFKQHLSQTQYLFLVPLVKFIQ